MIPSNLFTSADSAVVEGIVKPALDSHRSKLR